MQALRSRQYLFSRKLKLEEEEDIMSDYWTDDEIDEEEAYKLLTSL